MSHQMTALAMEQNLAPAPKIVLYWIANHHNGETGLCFPSINRLAKVSKISRRSVEKHISDLEDQGFIKITQRFRTEGGKTSNSYKLFLRSSEEFQSDTQNLRMGSAKAAHGDTQNLRMNNLGTNNLGIEKNILIEKFEDFYNYFPRKTAKGSARKAWVNAIAKTDPDVIISQAALFAASVEGKDKKFIPHPATWLNQERWDDEVFAQADSEQDQQNLVHKIFAEMVKPNA
tara:strand:- start:6108 stop:6800 length:693 start_codon:yes stop_codon:yes gene_type:complete